MASSEGEIANLLYRYAECVDSGDLAGAAQLFAHAKIKGATHDISADEALKSWQNAMILHEDGTPRTKHVITNPIIEVDEAAGRATCRSYCTVMQQAGDGPLQPILCLRHRDTFERVNGQWRFTYRDYGQLDLVGDISRHLHRARKAE